MILNRTIIASILWNNPFCVESNQKEKDAKDIKAIHNFKIRGTLSCNTNITSEKDIPVINNKSLMYPLI